MRLVLVRIDEDEADTGFGPGTVAVEAATCQPFTFELQLEDPRCSRARMLKVTAAGEQVPLTIATASTLYALQGTATTPRLIYLFRTPRRISAVMRWIPTYGAIARAAPEAVSLNWLNHSNQMFHRQRPSRMICDTILERLWRKKCGDAKKSWTPPWQNSLGSTTLCQSRLLIGARRIPPRSGSNVTNSGEGMPFQSSCVLSLVAHTGRSIVQDLPGGFRFRSLSRPESCHTGASEYGLI